MLRQSVESTQYTSAQLHQVCQQRGVRQSMGRNRACWDNAMAESFWSTLNTGFYDWPTWPTRAEARREVARWIDVVYNRRRLHSALGYTTPVEYEHALRATDAQATKPRLQAA